MALNPHLAARPVSSTRDPTVEPRAADQTPLPVFRWTILAVVLVAEFIGLSIAYDAHSRAGDPGWPGAVIAASPKVLRVGMVAGLVTAVFAGWYLRREIAAAVRTQSARAGWLFVLAHLAAFALFAFATARVLAPSTLDSPVGVGDLLFWLATGVMTGLFWAAAILPPRAWPRLAWQGRWAIFLGLLIASAGLLIAQPFQKGWHTLARPTLWLAHRFLRFFANDTVCDLETHQLGTETFWVDVTPPCSGYEGMGLMCAYLASYLWLCRRDLRFPHALLLVPIGLIAVWVANALRIALLILVGVHISPTLAVGGFHSQAGWIGFSAVALGIVWLSHRSRLFLRDRGERARTNDNPTAAYLAPLLAAVAVQMLTVAFVPAHEAWYPVRAGAAAVMLVWYWRYYEGLRAGTRAGALFGIAVGMGIFVMWLGLAQLMPTDTTDPRAVAAGWPTWAAGLWRAAWVIGFVLVTPLAEELAFRGYLLRRLIAADFERVPLGRFTWLSFLVSSALFGLLHGQWLAGTLAGMAYAAVVYRTGRLRDAVVAHAVTNGLLAMVGFTTGHWAG